MKNSTYIALGLLIVSISGPCTGYSYSDNLTDLVRAARKNSLEDVQICLKNGADVRQQEQYSLSTALHYAAENNNLPMVSYLFEHGAKINKQNSQGQTALMLTTDLEIVKYLIKRRAKINITDYNEHQEQTALFYAIKNNKPLIITYLLEHGAKIHDGDLLQAMRRKNYPLAKYLIEHGANVNATSANSTDMCIDYCCNIQTYCNPIIHDAIYKAAGESFYKENPEFEKKPFIDRSSIECFVRQGASQEEINLALESIALYKKEYEDLCKAQPEFKKNAFEYVNKCDLEFIDYLVTHGASQEQINKALYSAVEHDRYEIVVALVEKYGANINYQDSSSTKHLLMETKYFKIAKYLIDRGANTKNVNLKQFNYNPLSLEQIKYLVQHGIYDLGNCNCLSSSRFYFYSKNSDCIKIFEYLFACEKQGLWQYSTHDKIYALIQAIRHNNNDVIQYLINSEKININLLTEPLRSNDESAKYGQTYLSDIIFGNGTYLMSGFIKYGGNVNSQRPGCTYLRNSNESIMVQKTPLSDAIEANKIDIVKLLLKHKAKITAYVKGLINDEYVMSEILNPEIKNVILAHS